MSNPKARHGIKDAEGRLAEARKKAERSTQMLQSAAKTVGFAQMAAKQLDAGLARTLIDSASKTMELAQAESTKFEEEVQQAEKALIAAKQKPENKAMSNGSISTLRSKRRHFDCSEVDEDYNHGGTSNLKKSRVAKAVASPENNPLVPPSSSSHATPAAQFSFGAVPATLSDETFVFGGSKPAVAAAPASASTPDSASGIHCCLPTGKRKYTNENSSGDGAPRAKCAAREPRKTVKPSRKWYGGKARETAGNGKLNSIFASVKLAPSAAMNTDTSSKGITYGAPAKQTFSSSNPTGVPNLSKPNKADVKEEKDAIEEETLYKVRARHLKLSKDGWEKYETGYLSLLRHKSTRESDKTENGQCRIVIHNTVTL